MHQISIGVSNKQVSIIDLGRTRRRRRLDRGLVPRGDRGQRGSLRHHRARRQRLLDADEQLPAGEADLRHLRHHEHRQGGDRAGRARGLHRAGRHDVPADTRAAPNPPDSNFAGRVGDVALALAGADRELPRREQHRRLRPLGADQPDERRPVLGGAGEHDHHRA